MIIVMPIAPSATMTVCATTMRKLRIEGTGWRVGHQRKDRDDNDQAEERTQPCERTPASRGH